MPLAFLVAVVASIAFSAWASVPYFGYPLAGMSQADVSALYPNLVTPAPYAFSIWSLIYLSWIALAIAMLLNAAAPSRRFVKTFGAGILLSAVWLLPFHYRHEWWSLALMSAILLLAYRAMLAARAETLLPRFASELFFGWITVATLANIAVVVVSEPRLATLGIMPPVAWTLLGIGIGALAHIVILARHRVFLPSAVYIWALVANTVAHSDTVQRIGIAVCIVVLLTVAIYVRSAPVRRRLAMT